MTLFAKDIMVTNFDKVHEHAPAGEAIQKIMQGKVRESGYKSASLLVVNAHKELAGVVTMFDILYHLRPSYLNQGISGEEISWEGHLRFLVQRLGEKTVEQVMSRNVTAGSPNEHIMVLLDRMIKNKYRRLPITEQDRPIGIVYLEDVYYHLFRENRQ
ncbi:MAG: CBS domain-containing protein [Desulfococcus multivorans]|uniref:CBS domain-containing protein n=1 Tax=Desulfococcus sp. TaxID=2025834 RepID=UPI002A42BD13|nr:CBS domain-containing protein [Desulfococcus multivorans]